MISQIFEDVCIDALLASYSRKEEQCLIVRPACLVQIALTLPPHKGVMFLSLGLWRGQNELLRRQWLLRRRQEEVYFLILCNKDLILSL